MSNDWKCYSIPRGLGRTCGHINPPPNPRVIALCEKCQCTKYSSDQRRRVAFNDLEDDDND